MKKTARGFTLVELLVVITIMAIIGAYSLSNFGSFGKDQKLKSANQDIQSLLRQAQANASTKTKCNSVNNSTWQVIFSADRKTVTLGCQESETFYPKKVLDISKVDPSIQIQNISRAGIACPTDPGLPYTINFELLTGTMNLGEPRCTSFTVSLQNTAVSSLTNSLSMTTGGILQTRPSCDISGSQLNGLVGYWDFNEGNGTTVVDKSGFGHAGTWSTANWNPNGKIGSAGQFTGTNFVQINSPGGIQLPQGTICMWVKPSTNWSTDTTLQNLLGDASTRGWWLFNVGYNLWGLEHQMTFRITKSSSGEIYLGVAPSFTDQEWHQVCGSWDINTSQGNLYIDRTRYNSWSTYTPTDTVVMTQFNIGSGVRGLIDEVRIYNRALTDAEITASYNGGVGCSLF